MIRNAFIIAIALLVSAPALSAQEDSLRMDASLNSSAEAYALTFRDMEGGMEAWLTVGDDINSDKRVLARSACSNTGFGSTVQITDNALNAPNTTYNGVPTFNPCDPMKWSSFPTAQAKKRTAFPTTSTLDAMMERAGSRVDSPPAHPHGTTRRRSDLMATHSTLLRIDASPAVVQQTST